MLFRLPRKPWAATAPARVNILKTLTVLACVLFAGTLFAGEKRGVISWTGGGDGTSWSDPANWSGGSVPGNSDAASITISGGATINITTDIAISSIFLGPGSPSGSTFTLNIDGAEVTLGNNINVSNEGVVNVINNASVIRPVRKQKRGVSGFNIDGTVVFGDCNIGTGVDVSTVSGGSADVTGSAVFGSTIYFDGTFQVRADATFNGTAQGSGTLSVEGATLTANNDITNFGTVDVIGDASGDATIIYNSSSFNFENQGTVRLTNNFAGASAVIRCTNLEFDNTGGSTFTIDAGAGGGTRRLEGPLTNAGSMIVNYPLIVDAAGAANHTNQGSILLLESMQVIQQAGDVFTNEAGISIDAGKRFELINGSFDPGSVGSIIENARKRGTSAAVEFVDVSIINNQYNHTGGIELTLADCNVNAPLDNQSTIYIKGTVAATNTVVNQNFGSIILLGTTGHGSAIFDVPGPWTSQGTVTLTSEDASATASLRVGGGTGNFTNQGTVVSDAVAGPGATSPPREIHAALINNSTVQVLYPLIVYADGLTNVNNISSQIQVQSGQLTINQNGGSFTNQGSLQVDGLQLLRFNGGTFDPSTGTVAEFGVRKVPVSLPGGGLKFDSVTLQGGILNTSFSGGMGIYFVNATVDSGVSNPGNLIFEGNSTVNGSAVVTNPVGANLVVLGKSGLAATLNFLAPFTNPGNIILETEDPTQAVVANFPAGLINNGDISSSVGSGGVASSPYQLGAALTNNGTLTVDHDLEIPFGSGIHVNEGTFQVDAVLRFDLNSTGDSFTNNSTINIGSAGDLEIEGGTFDPGMGTITPSARGTSNQMLINGSTIANNTLTNNVDLTLVGVVFSAGASLSNQGPLTLRGSNAFGSSFTNQAAGSVIFDANAVDGDAVLTCTGLVDNQGLMTMNGDGGGAKSVIQGTAFSNSSTFTANAGSPAAHRIEAELSNSGTMDIHGMVEVDFNNSDHSNSSAINITGGYFQVNQTGVSPTFGNSGTITVDDGASLNVFNGVFNPSTGSITPGLIVSAKRLPPASSLFDGVLFSGAVHTNLIETTFLNCTFAADSGLDNQSAAVFLGSSSNAGSLANQAGANLTIEADGTNGAGVLTMNNSGFTNAGTLKLSSTDSIVTAALDLQSDTLTNANTGIFDIGPGTGSPAFLFNGGLINNGTVNIRDNALWGQTAVDYTNSGTLEVFNGELSVVQSSTDTFSNPGQISIGDGTKITITDGSFDPTGGTLTRPGGSLNTMELIGCTLVGGNLSSQVDLIFHNVTANLGVDIDNQRTLNIYGACTINGTLINGSSSILAINGSSTDGNGNLQLLSSFNNSGAVHLTTEDGSSSAVLEAVAGFINDVSGTLFSDIGSAGPDRSIQGTVDNRGTFEILHPLAINGVNASHLNSGTVNIGADWRINDTGFRGTFGTSMTNTGTVNLNLGHSMILVGASFDNHFDGLVRGVFNGSGMVDSSNGEFLNNGILRPGGLNNIGTLNIDGDIQLGANGIFEVEIREDSPSVFTADALVSTGDVNYSGTLDISLLSGAEPPPGESFAVVQQNTGFGTFATVNGSQINANDYFSLDYQSGGLNLVANTNLITWDNPLGGFWSDAANWSPAVVPGPESSVMIDLDGSYVVEIDTDVEVRDLTLGAAAGTQTINAVDRVIRVADGFTVGERAIFNMTGTTIGIHSTISPTAFDVVNNGLIIAQGLCSSEFPVVTNTNFVVRSHNPGTPVAAEFFFTSGLTVNGLLELNSNTAETAGVQSPNQPIMIAVGGRFRSHPGSGGSRYVSAEVVNNGLMEILTPVSFSLPINNKLPNTWYMDGFDGRSDFDSVIAKRNLVEGFHGQGLRLEAGQNVWLPEAENTDRKSDGVWSLEFVFKGDAGSATVPAPSALSAGGLEPAFSDVASDEAWHSVVWVYQDQRLSGYLDGLHFYETAEPMRITPDLTAAAGETGFSGVVDAVRLSGHALDARFAQARHRQIMGLPDRDSDTLSLVDLSPELLLDLRQENQALTAIADAEGWLFPGDTVFQEGQDLRMRDFLNQNWTLSAENYQVEQRADGLLVRGTAVKAAFDLIHNVGSYIQPGGNTVTMVGGDFRNNTLGATFISGTLDTGGFQFINLGNFSPGADLVNNDFIGPATITGDFVLDPAGTLIINIDPAGTPGSETDVLTVNGNASLDGRLLGVNVGGAPSLGNTYVFMTYTTSNGDFNFIQAPLPSGGVGFQAVQGTSDYAWQTINANFAGPQIFANQGTNDLLAVDPLTFNSNGQFTFAGPPLRPTPSPSGDHIFVPLPNQSQLAVIDARTNTVVTNINLGGQPETVGVFPDGSKAWVGMESGLRTPLVAVVDLTSFTVETTFSVSCVDPIALIDFNPILAEGYVVSSSGEICVIDPLTTSELRTTDIGGSPTDSFVHPSGQNLYIAGGDGGHLYQIDLTSAAMSFSAIDFGFLSSGAVAMHIDYFIADDELFVTLGTPDLGVYDVSGGTASIMDSSSSGLLGVVVLDDPVTGFVSDALGNAIPFDPVSNTFGTVIPKNGGSSVTYLTDNEAVTPAPGGFAFNPGTITVGEAAGQAILTVERTGSVWEDLNLSISSVDGTATSPSDYELVTSTLSIPSGDGGSRAVFVNIVNDLIPESTESFSIEATGSLRGFETATVNITDNDADDLISLGASFYSVQEDQGPLIIEVTRDGTGFDTATVDLIVEAAAGDTATPGTDFAAGTTTLTFNSQTKRIVVEVQNPSIAITDDNIEEPTETFTIRLANFTGFAGPGAVTTAAASILDDDLPAEPATVSFLAQSYSGAENDRIPVVLERGGNTAVAVSGVIIPSRRIGDTAEPGIDFSTDPIPFSFSAGAKRTTITVDAIPLDDARYENNETFSLDFSGLSANVQVIGITRAQAIISDNDIPLVSWSTASSTIVEGTSKTALTLTANLSVTPSIDVNVPYTVGGTATPGVDHNLVAGTVNFRAGSNRATLNINVVEDRRDENDETLIVTLSPRFILPGTPTTHTITILDDDEPEPTTPNTLILEPASRSNFRINTPFNLVADVEDRANAVNPTFNWEICRSNGGCTQFQGQTINDVAISVPGVYRITCVATDNGLTDPTPALVIINILENITPVINFTDPVAPSLALTVGDQYTFQVAANDPDGDDITTEFFFISDPETRFPGSTLTRTFDEAGTFALVAVVRDALGAEATDQVVIRVSEPGQRQPGLSIIEPEPAEIFEVGETVNLVSVLENPDNLKKAFQFFWTLGDGRVVETQNEQVVFNEAGRYHIRVFAYDPDTETRLEDSVVIFVRNNGLPPVVDINLTGDITIEPGDTVYLRGVLLDARGHAPNDLSFQWNFGDGTGSDQIVPGGHTYDQEGVYTVSMFALTPDNVQSNIVSRRITVEESNDTNFEPNEGPSQASSLQPGSYSNLALDDNSLEDWFQVTIANGQTLSIQLELTEPATLEVYNAAQNLIATEHVLTSGSIILPGLNPGLYYIRIFVEAQAGKRIGLSYGLDIDVLNPALFLPDIRNSGGQKTEIGLVNTSGDDTSIEILAYDIDGDLLDSAQFKLKPRGRLHLPVDDLFPEQGSSVAWIQVDATADITGYANTESLDEKEFYSVTASKTLSSDLFVPHIAERVEQWFTRATVVNGKNGALSSKMTAPASPPVNLDLDAGFKQDSFEFVDRFGGSLPEGGVWASFTEDNGEPAMAGTEVFGTFDGTRIAAGLELVDNSRNNPNFTFVRNNIYFTHVARDTSQFWTGLALVNVSENPQNVNIKAYGPEGNLVNTKQVSLAGNEKLVQVAESFLDGIGSPANVDWIEIEADSEIVGFELFGTHDGKRLAGFEATTGLKTEICFPYYDDTGNSVHGVSVVNPTDAANTLTITLYDDNGAVLGTVSNTLDARQKRIFTINELFPPSAMAITDVPGWLAVTGSQPLAGFELIVNLNGEKMSALIAK